MRHLEFEFENYVQRIACPSWNIKEGVINFHDLTFIYKGEAIYNINGKPHKVSSGDFIYIPSGSLRSAYTFEENPMHAFALNLKIPEDFKMPFPTLFHPGIDEMLIELYSDFDRAWLAQSKFKEVRTRAYFMLILCRLNELFIYPAQSDRRIEHVKEYILTNYYKKIDVKMLADMVDLNQIYFGTLFKKNTGQNVNEYISRIRVNKAKDLLGDGLSITETALSCGFENIFYFSNVFKKVTGKSPSEYKNNIIG